MGYSQRQQKEAFQGLALCRSSDGEVVGYMGFSAGTRQDSNIRVISASSGLCHDT